MADENGIGNGTENENGSGSNDTGNENGNGNDGTNWNNNWFDGPGIDYLANLKGVTIPNTTPTIDTNPRRGKHSSSDNTITADDPDIQPLIKALNAEAVNSIPWPTEPKDVSGEFEEQDKRAERGKNEGKKEKAEAAPEVVQAAAPKPTQTAVPEVMQAAAPNAREAVRETTSLDTAIQDAPPTQFATAPIPEETPTMEQMPTVGAEANDDIDAAATVTLPPQPASNQMTSAAAYRAADDSRSNLANLAVTTQERRAASNANDPTRSAETTSAFEDVEQFVDSSFQTGEIVNDAEKAVMERRRGSAMKVAAALKNEHPEAPSAFVHAMTSLVMHNASDVHLVVGDPPMLRVDGRVRAITGEPALTKDDTIAMIEVMTTEVERERFKHDLELDVSFSIGTLLRFRVNVYQDRSGWGAALRNIPLEIKSCEQLGLDPKLADLGMLPRGLVLVCGPTGSGKSTTLAAILDHANQKRTDHIITIEDPIEFVHHHKSCIVSQREVGTDTTSFSEALKHALREDPDIIEVGELRDLETISTALTAAETGHLVLATLHTQDAGSTVDRLIDVYPENQQQQIRVQVASTLRAVIIQTLLPKASEHGRVPATEIMYATPAVAALIRGSKTHQIRTQLQAGGELGMHTLDQDLARLVNNGEVTFEDAESRAQYRDEFEKLVNARRAY